MEHQSYKIFDSETEKILEGLRIADCMNLLNLEEECDKSEDNTTTYNLKELAVSDVLTCSYCNITFNDASHQRNHYKLDWHRYNLKRALAGNKSVPEEVFNSLADDVSSISGSDSERSDDSDTETSEPSKIESPESFRYKYKSYRHSKVFFENKENKILSVYRCLLHSKKENPVKEKLIQSLYDVIKKPKKWMIVLLGGGHFASAIFNDGEILNHKTFHSYTVRAKQGGSQSARDNKGGSHPKSAGASLRRYNEQALVQHVQEIMSSWSELLKQCSLILYRATGPYNRGVLFGGKNPVLLKTDQRLRNIPFPTRRPTFKEVKRVYDMLSSIEVHGSADLFKDKFPSNPDKRTWSPKSKKGPSCDAEHDKAEVELQKKTNLNNGKSQERGEGSSQKRTFQEDPQVKISSESESENESKFELLSSEVTISFQDLQEYDDTVPQYIKDLKNSRLKQKKKRKKSNCKQKGNSERKKWSEEFEQIQKNLIKSFKHEDNELLMETLAAYRDLPKKESIDSPDATKPNSGFTKEDFIDCLNTPVEEETKNTILHLAALKGLPEFVTKLLSSGADPTVKNKNKLTPYVIAKKETRDAFRLFASSFPDKYDYKKANIPEPVTEEKAKELEEKKKEKKKLKRIKEKIKKQEDKEKKIEEKEKEKFLALSDREKCALAAERRLLTSSTANVLSAKPPVLSRCFQCGVDITGIVAFEYGNNRFCTISCLKAHRLKTNSYGKEI